VGAAGSRVRGAPARRPRRRLSAGRGDARLSGVSSPPAAPGRLSAIEAAQQAIDHTSARLFPFRFEQWLVLGLLAFLDQCGRTGGFSSPPLPGGGADGGSGLPDPSRITDWLGAHAATAMLIAAATLALVLGLMALVLWINSRGIFMYVDAVATGRVEIARPWREHADRAGSLFAWRFALSAAALLMVVVAVALVFLGVVGVQDGRFSARVAIGLGLLVMLPVMAVALLALSLLSVALRDFAAPIQIARSVSCGEALRLVLGLARAHPGAFVGYVLLKIVFAIALAVAGTLVGCATCCLGFLPVVMQALLQPAFYFERAWSLYLLRAAGYDLIPPPAPPPSAEPEPGPPRLPDLGPAPGLDAGPVPEPDPVAGIDLGLFRPEPGEDDEEGKG